MSDIQPGDIVVCVNAGPWFNNFYHNLAMPLVLGRHYRVTRSKAQLVWVTGLINGFHVDRFRKLGDCDPEWVERIVRLHAPEHVDA